VSPCRSFGRKNLHTICVNFSHPVVEKLAKYRLFAVFMIYATWHSFCDIFSAGPWPGAKFFKEGAMKRTALLVFLTVMVCGITFAQAATPTTTVDGILGLSNGRIVLRSGDTIYYTRGLERFIGFIDGLKEGAQVAIEGYVSPPSLEGATERLLFPVKLTLNDKVYEVGSVMTRNRDWPRPRGAPGQMGRDLSRRRCW
jgi:hypothetical protein